jgi:hypothetical protein
MRRSSVHIRTVTRRKALNRRVIWVWRRERVVPSTTQVRLRLTRTAGHRPVILPSSWMGPGGRGCMIGEGLRAFWPSLFR